MDHADLSSLIKAALANIPISQNSGSVRLASAGEALCRVETEFFSYSSLEIELKFTFGSTKRIFISAEVQCLCTKRCVWCLPVVPRGSSRRQGSVDQQDQGAPRPI